MNPKYKALIFDLDGTAVPNHEGGMPSPRLIHAIQKAKQKIPLVAIATGRPLSTAAAVLETLRIESPSALSGGAQIYHPKTQTMIWERKLPAQLVREIAKRCEQSPYAVLAADIITEEIRHDQPHMSDKTIVYITHLKEKDIERVKKALADLENVSVHFTPSWTPGFLCANITHVEASKKHAVNEVLKQHQIQSEEVLVVGDSGNDLPLFEAGGFKVAMGNGHDELKQAADFVAPSIDEDGLAVAIEKFILGE